MSCRIATRRMWSKRTGVVATLILIAASMASSPAAAIILTAGQTTLSAAGADPEIGGTIVATQISPMAAPTFAGSLISKVIANDPANPHGLTFTYQFSNSGPNSLSRFTISSFDGFAADTVYVAGPNVSPTMFDRSLSDDVIGFSFIGAPLGDGKVVPGSGSDVLVVRTDAVDYQSTLAAIINGSTAQPLSFAPLRIVPEPSGIVLVVLGMLSVGVMARQKRFR